MLTFRLNKMLFLYYLMAWRPLGCNRNVEAYISYASVRRKGCLKVESWSQIWPASDTAKSAKELMWDKLQSSHSRGSQPEGCEPPGGLRSLSKGVAKPCFEIIFSNSLLQEWLCPFWELRLNRYCSIAC